MTLTPSSVGRMGGIEDLGEPAVTEMLLDWLDPFLTIEEEDRLLGWHLEVSLLCFRERNRPSLISQMGSVQKTKLLL